jgi:predicted DNA-binding mobile mystery protein A
MTQDQLRLARASLDRRLTGLRQASPPVPPRGWLRAIREALGMTPKALGERMGVSRTRVNALEKAEASGATTLNSLRQAAAALDCVLVYALVPRSSLEETLRRQAERQADAELARLDHTMHLENQALSTGDLQAARDRMIQALLDGPPRRLWTDPEG